MSYSREWLEDVGSEDCHSRVLWSLGYTIFQVPSTAILSLSNQLFKQGLRCCVEFSSPRAWAYGILGCLYYLRRFGGDTETKSTIIELGRRLSKMYTGNRTEEWLWFENVITYANARMPEALIAAGKYLNDRKMMEQGLEALNWLITVQTAGKGKHISLVGNQGWYKKGGRKSRFDQQPVDAHCLLEACYQAYEVTNDEHWRLELDRIFLWFLGKNDKIECLYDFRTGGCYDGLQRGGVNLNQGAESTLAWLAALHLMVRISHGEIIPSVKIELAEADQETSKPGRL